MNLIWQKQVHNMECKTKEMIEKECYECGSHNTVTKDQNKDCKDCGSSFLE